jgi:hypothetical protein
MYLKLPEKWEVNTQIRRWKETIKLRAEINEIELPHQKKKSIQKTNEMQIKTQIPCHPSQIGNH